MSMRLQITKQNERKQKSQFDDVRSSKLLEIVRSKLNNLINLVELVAEPSKDIKNYRTKCINW